MVMQKSEIAIYLLIACGSLLMISFIPHMLLDGLIEDETKEKLTVGLTIAWACGLGALGWDIYSKRKKALQEYYRNK